MVRQIQFQMMLRLFCVFACLFFFQELSGQQRISIAKNKQNDICFALYTVNDNTLKLTAQFYPITGYNPFTASLQLKRGETWETVHTTAIDYPGYTARFRVEDWDDTQERNYRVVYHKDTYYEGIIRRNPVAKDTLVMAAFSCWSTYQKHGGNGPAQDIIDNLRFLQPDLLFFAGDQVYDHSKHYENWLKFGEVFGDIIRNTPTITIPDDHDVGQGNFWGDGGRKANSRDGTDGGYYMPLNYLEEVERAQTSHLPDPYDPTPISRGIGVYYTDYTWGGVSFAIIEDRKFKSGPRRVLDKRSYADTREMNVPEATLLGQRQLDFLEHWTTDWEDAEMKAVLSQTIFANVSTHSPTIKKRNRYSVDSNGWPQAGRNKALSIIRKSFACMIAGDQHLGSVIHHGIEDWNNAGYSFAVPAAANFWMRYWLPDLPGKNQEPGAPAYTGEYLDAFHNKITVHAIANPTHEDNTPTDNLLNGRASGYGVIRFDKSSRKTTFECWPRNVDLSTTTAAPYPDWPVTFRQTDNFLIRDGYQLPLLNISLPDQVVTVKNYYTSEVVLSLRIHGSTYQPSVLSPGLYTIEIGEGPSLQRLFEIEATKGNAKELQVKMPQ